MVDNLEIKEHGNDLDLDITSSDPIDSAIMKYKSHPSFTMVPEKMLFESRFKFKVVNENDKQRQISNLNSKKPETFGYVP